MDIDGVIQGYDSNNRFSYDLEALQDYLVRKYNNEIYFKIDKYDLGATYYDWDNIALGYIKQLSKDTNSAIVLHTSWIKQCTLPML